MEINVSDGDDVLISFKVPLHTKHSILALADVQNMEVKGTVVIGASLILLHHATLLMALVTLILILDNDHLLVLLLGLLLVGALSGLLDLLLAFQDREGDFLKVAVIDDVMSIHRPLGLLVEKPLFISDWIGEAHSVMALGGKTIED